MFWVHASNAARLEQSFRDIADRVKIQGRSDANSNIFKLVHDWLHDVKQQWLLILDNVDDARFLLDHQTVNSASSSKPLREYLPNCERGSFLITTRNRGAALKLVEQRDIISINPMDETEAQMLLEKKLHTEDSKSDTAELAAVLEYMPLAIVQAAAYILRGAPRCSVQQYLREFKKSEGKRTSLLRRDEGQLRRDREATNSIIITWQISFEHIQQVRPTAADLLSLMSFFDRQGIPERLLRHQTEQDKNQRSEEHCIDDACDSNEDNESSQSSADGEEFEDDVLVLREFSFVSINADQTTFEMHALVQLATRKWLEANGELEPYKQRFITTLCAAFPTGRHENWAVCETLFPHAISALDQQPEGEPSLVEWWRPC